MDLWGNMSTNHYFKNNNSFPQQELLNDLTREVIQMSGTDIWYLPRTVVNNDDILGEDTLTKFDSAYELEMYINNTDAFGGAGDLSTKFGLDVQDELILVCNKERFKTETQMFAPKEGDLIYFPTSRGLFEIKFVEHEKPFYSLGKNTVFEITTEKFQYSGEKFNIPAGQMGSVFEKFERRNSISITMTLEDGATEYKVGETVYQGADESSATGKAIVSAWSKLTKTIAVYNKIGTFVLDQNLVGVTSAVSRNVVGINDQMMAQNTFASNDEFETEGDNILDFSEIDPWAEGDL